MQQIRSAAMIVNAQSRKGQALFETACAHMKDAPFPVDSHAVTDPKKLDATVEQALAKKPDILILGGGDGTISGLVHHLIGTDVALGVLPLGTANSFARTLGLPLDIEGALDVIARGKLRRIDLGQIDDKYFANCAALGLSPQIAKTVPHKLKKYLGRAGYLLWASYEFVRFRPFTLILGEGAEQKRLKVVEVRIANGRFHGGTELIEDQQADSGSITVQAVTGHLKRRLVWNWFASTVRLPSRHETVENFEGSSFRIDTKPRLKLSIDGELMARTPFTARVAKGAVCVAVP